MRRHPPFSRVSTIINSMNLLWQDFKSASSCLRAMADVSARLLADRKASNITVFIVDPWLRKAVTIGHSKTEQLTIFYLGQGKTELQALVRLEKTKAHQKVLAEHKGKEQSLQKIQREKDELQAHHISLGKRVDSLERLIGETAEKLQQADELIDEQVEKLEARLNVEVVQLQDAHDALSKDASNAYDKSFRQLEGLKVVVGLAIGGAAECLSDENPSGDGSRDESSVDAFGLEIGDHDYDDDTGPLRLGPSAELQVHEMREDPEVPL